MDEHPATQPDGESPEEPVRHPVRLRVTDDLRRSRATVFFRLLLAIPHIIWVVLWSIAVFFVAILAWVLVLITGKLPAGLHRFFNAYIRYVTHLTAYVTLAANPFPPFNGEPGAYPVDVLLPAEPQPQSRWRALIRLILAIPALFLYSVFLSPSLFAGGARSSGTSGEGGGGTVSGVLAVGALLGWFSSLATGRMPKGLRDMVAYGSGYRAQTLAYLLFVTERYPNADPRPLLETVEPPAVHGVHIATDDGDLRRSRVTVLFRLPLAIPHLVWLQLWGVLAGVAQFVQWWVLLVRGRPVQGLHRFLSAYLRYGFHVWAFLTLAANPFPGFTGAPATYPLELALPEPARQNRWKTLFRILLVLPAFFVTVALVVLLFLVSVFTWVVGLLLGRAPEGLHRSMVYALRYVAQVYAYWYLVTDAYPHASPLEGADEPEAAEPPPDYLFAQA